MNAGIVYGGCGHWAVALANNNIRTTWYYELWKPAVKCFKANWPNVTVYDDIRDINGSGVNIIVGSPHCNGLSSANPKSGLSHPANKLMFNFIDVVKRTKPEAFIMEESSRLLTFDKFSPLSKRILERYRKIGYHFRAYVLDSHEYGSPQIRKRSYIIGFKHNIYDYHFQLPERALSKNAVDVIPKSEYSVNKDYHRRPYKGERGPWGMYQSRTATRIIGETCPTITSQAFRDIRHPSMRFLSWQELSCIMGFPDGYIFPGSLANKCALIGKGVDIRFVSRLLESVKEAIDG